MPIHRNVFGVISHSPFTFLDLLRPWLAKHRLKAFILDNSDKFEPADLYIAIDFGAFKAHARQLAKQRSVLVIFDTPVVLSEIKGLQYLDVDKPKLSYVLKLEPLNFKPVKRTLTANHRHRLALEWTKLDLIPKLIEKARKGKLLDKLQTLVYNTSNTDTRRKVHRLVVSYFFEKTTLKQLEAKLKETYKRSKTAKIYLAVLLEYLHSKSGQQLWQASQIAAKSLTKSKKSKAINYKALSKTYNIDKFELKYLVRSFRTSDKEAGFKPVPLDDYIAQQPKQRESASESP